jgi:manganese transport protein
MWLLCEVAIMATDLAEVLGAAIGLKLLFQIPILYGVILTACDTLLLLLLRQCGSRMIELLILVIMTCILVCFIIELGFSKPDVVGVLYGVVPTFPTGSIPISAGMLGATIMPHNIYLHSGLIIRKRSTGYVMTRRLTRFAVIDSFFSLHIALFLNGAILVMAAASFYGKHEIEALEDASSLLGSLFGKGASIVFGIALLLAGQQSTITGTIAGEIVMEGFLKLRIPAVFRRLLTRCLAIIPAAVVIIVVGDAGASSLLLWSQVILSVCLPFAMVPLIRITSNDEMGIFKNGLILKLICWASILFVTGLNVWLIIDTIQTNFGEPPWWRLGLFVTAGAIFLLFLLIITFIPIKPKQSLVLFKTEKQRQDELKKIRSEEMEQKLEEFSCKSNDFSDLLFFFDQEVGNFTL